MRSWTDEQKAVIDLPLGHASVLACAGSGKTAVVVERVTRLASIGAIDPENTAIITFTRLAADELRSRLSHSFREAGIKGAPYIGTIHGFCLSHLKGFDPEVGETLRVLTEGQQFAALYNNWSRWNLGEIDPQRSKSRLIKALIKTFDIIDLESIDQNTLAEQCPAITSARSDYVHWMRDNNYIDYTGMLAIFRRRLGEANFLDYMASKVQFLVVDEYQDTDPVQGDIFRTLSLRASLMVVGDDDQCIYQFRGTTPQNIIGFRDEIQGSTQHLLSANFRSGKQIVDFAQASVETVSERAPKRMRANASGGLVSLQTFDDPEAEAEWIASRISSLLSSREALDPGDIAILMRSVSSYGEVFVRALQRHGIPYIIRGDGSLLEQGEVKAAIAALELIQRDALGAEAVPLVEDVLGHALSGADTIPQEVSIAEISSTDWRGLGCDHEEAQLLMRLFALREQFAEQRFGSCLEFFLDLLVALGVAQPALPEKIHRNWAQLTKIIQEYDEVVGGRSIRHLLNYLRAYGEGAFDAADTHPKESGVVHILTIHRSKGLEFAHVFLPMLVEGRFPVRPRRPDVLIPIEVAALNRYAGSRDDEVRLFYVAATRAIERLHLSYSRKVSEVRQARPSSLLHGMDRYYGGQHSGRVLTARGQSSSLSTSYSRLEYYLSCPHRYHMIFDVGYATPQNPFFSFGRLLHLVLRLAHEAEHAGAPLTEEAVESLFDKHFALIKGVPALTLRGMRRRGLQAIRHYLTVRKEWLKATRATELPFSYVQDGRLPDGKLEITLSGQADLLVEDNGSYHVIDFKSGRPHPYIRTDLQLRLYCLALKQTHGISVERATVYYIEHDHPVHYAVDDAWIHQGSLELEAAAVGIAKRSFEPTPGEVCGRCELKRMCAFGGKL